MNEEKLLAYILGYYDENGYSPTIQEMADRMELSVTGTHKIVKKLNKKGHLIKKRTLVYRQYVPKIKEQNGKCI